MKQIIQDQYSIFFNLSPTSRAYILFFKVSWMNEENEISKLDGSIFLILLSCTIISETKFLLNFLRVILNH